MSTGGKLSGRVALVTGASSWIGKSSALVLHGEGAKVALIGRRAGPLQELARIPLWRPGAAEEVAKAVLYLATDAAYATGMTMALDGGTTIV